MQTILTLTSLACIDTLAQATKTNAEVIKDNLIKAIRDSDFEPDDTDSVEKTKDAIEFALQACITAGIIEALPYISITDIINLRIYQGDWWYRKANENYALIPPKFVEHRTLAFILVTSTVYDFVSE